MKKTLFFIGITLFFSGTVFPHGINIFQIFLLENRIPIIIDFDTESIYISDSIEKQELGKLINLFILRINVIESNIINHRTTRTSNGKPFRRQIVTVVDGKVRIIDDLRTEVKLIYDPTHPDAIPNGARKGYVEYPNIDFITELVDLIATVRYFELLIKAGIEKELIN